MFCSSPITFLDLFSSPSSTLLSKASAGRALAIVPTSLRDPLAPPRQTANSSPSVLIRFLAPPSPRSLNLHYNSLNPSSPLVLSFSIHASLPDKADHPVFFTISSRMSLWSDPSSTCHTNPPLSMSSEYCVPNLRLTQLQGRLGRGVLI